MTRDIGKIRKEMNVKNRQEVYKAVSNLNQKVKLRDIMIQLDKQTEHDNIEMAWKEYKKYEEGYYNSDTEMKKAIKRKLRHTVSEKTVQRCIASDPRIESDGRKYFVTLKARFESHYLEPEYFGSQMIFEIIGKLNTPKTLEGKIKHFVLRFGAFIIFNFIEAVRPFKDDSLSVKEKEDLVAHWARTAVPLDYMFQLFQGTFDVRRRQKHDWKTPFSEMKDERIDQILVAFQKTFPEIYKDLLRGRKETFGKTVVEVNPGVAIDVIHDLLFKSNGLLKDPHP